MNRTALVALLTLLPVSFALAQGQDSHPAERDLAVINEMLSGLYVNGNQAYFEGRLKTPEADRHRRLEMTIERANFGFLIKVGDSESATSEYLASLSADLKAGFVRMDVASLANAKKPDRCSYLWEREAMQFRARVDGKCADSLPRGLVLSQQQFWIYPSPGDTVAADNPYKLHRARRFSCYADIPGVGGGRDIPYERYDGLELHDQGGAVWFDTREEPSRRMGVSLFLVDWPINNYDGIFTRDSLVVYISEEIDGTRKEHGYAFTVPDADRVGINLKWMLASCFMVPSTDATPSM